jgi:hypothetical protein
MACSNAFAQEEEKGAQFTCFTGRVTNTDVLSAALVSAQQSASRLRRPSTPASAPLSKTFLVPILLLTKYLFSFSPSA